MPAIQTERIAALKRKLAAREGKKEFEKNCEHIRAEIARIEGRADDQTGE